MTLQRTLWSVALALCCVAAVMTGNLLSQAENQLPPPRLDVASEPHAVLYWEFLDSGWGPHDAAVLSARTIDIILGVPVEPFEPSQPTAADATLLDPDSEPLAIFYWAFLDSGHSPEVAANYARRMQRRILGIEPENPEAARVSTTDLQVYPTRIVYCENGQRKTHRGYIDAPCWETTGAPCYQVLPKCPRGEAAWLPIDLSSEDFPCSWLRVGGLMSVGEDTETMDCGCFEEIDCEELDPPQCCDHHHGCGEIGTPSPDCGE